jgi:hypothetical protein
LLLLSFDLPWTEHCCDFVGQKQVTQVTWPNTELKNKWAWPALCGLPELKPDLGLPLSWPNQL